MKIKNIFSALLGIYILVLILVSTSCKKSIEVGPSKTAATSSNAFTTNSGAQSVVSGILSRMSLGGFYQGGSSVSLCMGLASDELLSLNPSSSSIGSFYLNSYTAVLPPPFWTEMYKELFFCNTAINGIQASSAISPAVKTQLVGELKFIRAYIYFYAVNLYGTPPLTLTDDYTLNNTIANSPSDQIYAQIIKDLTDAQSSLADNIYVDGTGATVTDRVRPNKQVATALLARVYLYLQDWKNAEAQASAVIANSNYTLVTNLNQVFLKGSKETIWALQPVSTTYLNTIDAYYLIVTTVSSATTQLPLNKALVNTFEAGDGRLANWTGTYTTTPAPITTYRYANKYKVSSLSSTVAVTEYPIMMRFAEQYLIRAEARAQQGNTAGAATDLNAIRLRAGLAATTFTTQADLLNAIYHERQVELFTEWGHRWFDLKRTGKLDALMNTVAPAKGTTWSTYKQLMPIPATDILADPNLKQNAGYN